MSLLLVTGHRGKTTFAKGWVERAKDRARTDNPSEAEHLLREGFEVALEINVDPHSRSLDRVRRYCEARAIPIGEHAVPQQEELL